MFIQCLSANNGEFELLFIFSISACLVSLKILKWISSAYQASDWFATWWILRRKGGSFHVGAKHRPCQRSVYPKIPGHHEVVVLQEDLEIGIFLDAIIGLSWRRKGKLRIRVPHCPFLTWQFQKWNFGILTYVPCSAAIV